MNVIDQKPWQIHYCIIFHHSCFIIQLHYDWWNTSFYLEPQWTKSMNRQTTKRFIREPFRLFIRVISTISQCNWHFKGQMAFSCITWKSTLFSSMFSQEIWLDSITVRVFPNNYLLTSKTTLALCSCNNDFPLLLENGALGSFILVLLYNPGKKERRLFL